MWVPFAPITIWAAVSFGGEDGKQGFIVAWDPATGKLLHQSLPTTGFQAIAIHPESGGIYAIDTAYYPDFQDGQSNFCVVNAYTGAETKVLGKISFPQAARSVSHLLLRSNEALARAVSEIAAGLLAGTGGFLLAIGPTLFSTMTTHCTRPPSH